MPTINSKNGFACTRKKIHRCLKRDVGLFNIRIIAKPIYTARGSSTEIYTVLEWMVINAHHFRINCKEWSYIFRKIVLYCIKRHTERGYFELIERLFDKLLRTSSTQLCECVFVAFKILIKSNGAHIERISNSCFLKLSGLHRFDTYKRFLLNVGAKPLHINGWGRGGVNLIQTLRRLPDGSRLLNPIYEHYSIKIQRAWMKYKKRKDLLNNAARFIQMWWIRESFNRRGAYFLLVQERMRKIE